MCCSQECFQEYMRRITNSRAKVEAKNNVELTANKSEETIKTSSKNRTKVLKKPEEDIKE